MAGHIHAGLWSANSWLHIDLPPALQDLGIGLVPLPVDSPQALLRHYVHTAHLQTLICDAARADLARSWMPDLPVVELEPGMDAAAIRHRLMLMPACAATGACVAPPRILFSSGTSGRPRAVLRAADSDQYRIHQFIERFGLHRGLRHIVAGPLYHSGPAIFALTHHLLGCEVQLLERFSAGLLLDRLASTRERTFTLFLVPTQVRLLEHERIARAMPWSVYDSVARLWVAGSRFDADLKQLFARQLAPETIWEFYGATETGTISIQSQAHMRAKPEAVGQPVAGVAIQVRTAEGRTLPAGSVGRLWVRSPMNAYEVRGDTPLKCDSDGYICLGDSGWLDADGDLFLAGREADMMISGGVNVYPAQVEDALRELPQVADALAYGVPDPLWGQRVEALMIPRGNPTEVSRVLEALRSSLPAAARPRHLRWVAELPRTASGKPDRLAARKLAENVL